MQVLPSKNLRIDCETFPFNSARRNSSLDFRLSHLVVGSCFVHLLILLRIFAVSSSAKSKDNREARMLIGASSDNRFYVVFRFGAENNIKRIIKRREEKTLTRGERRASSQGSMFLQLSFEQRETRRKSPPSKPVCAFRNLRRSPRGASSFLCSQSSRADKEKNLRRATSGFFPPDAFRFGFDNTFYVGAVFPRVLPT